MTAVKIEERAVPVIEEGIIKYSPGVRFGGKGDFILISHQGNVLVYDTIEEAEDYFKD